MLQLAVGKEQEVIKSSQKLIQKYRQFLARKLSRAFAFLCYQSIEVNTFSKALKNFTKF